MSIVCIAVQVKNPSTLNAWFVFFFYDLWVKWCRLFESFPNSVLLCFPPLRNLLECGTAAVQKWWLQRCLPCMTESAVCLRHTQASERGRVCGPDYVIPRAFRNSLFLLWYSNWTFLRRYGESVHTVQYCKCRQKIRVV